MTLIAQSSNDFMQPNQMDGAMDGHTGAANHYAHLFFCIKNLTRVVANNLAKENKPPLRNFQTILCRNLGYL